MSKYTILKNNRVISKFVTRKSFIILCVFFYTITMFICMKVMLGNNDKNTAIQSKSEGTDYKNKIIMPTTTKLLKEAERKNSPKTNTKSVILILAKNSDLKPLRQAIRELEDRFNKNYKYPYVVLNEEPFDKKFMDFFQSSISSSVKFGRIKKEHWSVPAFLDENKVNEKMEEMKKNRVFHGDKISYHHMCRYFSGFFMNHELLQEYDYYWRVEPNVHFYCDIDFDPFLFMQQNKKEYAFVIGLKELENTIPTLWRNTIEYAKTKNLDTHFLKFFSNYEDDYNLCHFWSNFEIASLKFMRSKKYQDYFEYLDKTGNFYYERWGDAPVHSLALGLFLNKSQVHFFDRIGYRHDDFFHCPDVANSEYYDKICLCPDKGNFDNTPNSCLPRFKVYKDQIWSFKH